MPARIPIDRQAIAEFCQRHRIRKLSLFGSVLRDDFGPDSDVDVLVTFSDEAEWTLFHLVEMEEELALIFDRDVDLVVKKGIERSPNHLRRRAILNSAEPVYVA